MAKLYAIVRYSLATTSIIANVHRHFRCGFLDCRYYSSGAISADSPFCTDTPRSKNGARTASRLPSKDRVGSSAPSQFHRDEIAGCLNGPVYQPDEEHATARRRPRRDACPRIAAVPRPPCSQSKSRDKEHCLFGKARDGVILPARLGRRDKANWRSLAPFGRKGLSAHWILQVSAASQRRGARCAGVARLNFLFNFNLLSDGARNVRREGAPLFLRHHAR